MNLSIHYIHNTYTTTPITYSFRDKEHMFLNMETLDYLTPRVLRGHIQMLTEEIVDLDLCEKILDYGKYVPEHKDVTVVFSTHDIHRL